MIHRPLAVLSIVLALCCDGSEEYSETYESPPFPSAIDRLGCVKYGIDVQITGTLARDVGSAFPASSDQPNPTRFVVQLPRPICAGPFPLDGHYPAISDVTRIHLVVDSSAGTDLVNIVGRDVTVEGMASPYSGEGGDSIVILKVRSWTQID